MLINNIYRLRNSTSLRYLFSNKKSQEQLAYNQQRLKTLQQFTYPALKPTVSVTHFHQKYHQIKQQQKQPQIVAGRITSVRKHGKTTFIDVRQQHIRLQIAVQGQSDQPEYRRGDVIGATGVAFVTKKGELSLLVAKKEDIWVVSPCLWMLPEYNSLKDNQTRHRYKHIDLITNPHSLQMIKMRSAMISALRQELSKRQYIEVETPTLSASCGGAIAKPFITYHNDHKMNLFMRIAPELFLKRLLIGGMQRVFEIGKNFRNQSIDQTHNPQFTSCELYCAYADYRDMLLTSMVRKARKSDNCLIKFQDKSIDLAGQWLEIDFIRGLEQATGQNFPTDFTTSESLAFLSGICQKYSVPCDQPRTAERMLDKLAGRFLQHRSYEKPLLIMHHPRILSPLAKPLTDRPHLTARFQLFVRGWQLVNSYTELNNPQVQRANTPEDLDFVEALQYGLMPCAGWGLGVDRLAMLIGDSERIQDVIIFPLLKEKQE